MRVLLLSSRFPWPAFTGDRVRATVWLSALERDHDVVLVAPPGRIPATAPRFRFHPVRRSAARAVAGAFGFLGGAPLQALLAGQYDWADAIARARADAGPFDATVVLLSRMHPAVHHLLPDGVRVLDAIDSLSRNTSERAREASPLTRWFWRAEARRVGRVEDEVTHFYDRVLVVSDGEEATELGAATISSGVAISPLVETPRAYDFGFWGRLGYFANADAVSWLLDTIWPAIRAQAPKTTLLIAGADASRAIRAAHGRDGVVVQSPVDDMTSLVRQVKVALFPMRYGTGQLTKVLEAAEAGCAIVATTKAMHGLGMLLPHTVIANETGHFARAAVALHADEARRDVLARRLRETVTTTCERGVAMERLAAVLELREGAA